MARKPAARRRFIEVTLKGEAGAGKSTLAKEIAEAAQRLGCEAMTFDHHLTSAGRRRLIETYPNLVLIYDGPDAN